MDLFKIMSVSPSSSLLVGIILTFLVKSFGNSSENTDIPGRLEFFQDSQRVSRIILLYILAVGFSNVKKLYVQNHSSYEDNGRVVVKKEG